VQPKLYAKAEPPKAKKDAHTDGKGKSKSQPIVKDGKTITLVPLSPKQVKPIVNDDQMKLKRECEDGESENTRKGNGERRPSNLAKPISLIKPIESGSKTR